jgi:AraC-like DNA-binding protein
MAGKAIISSAPKKMAVKKPVTCFIAPMAVYFLLLFLPGKVIGINAVLSYGESSTSASDTAIMEYLTRGKNDVSLLKNDSLSHYAFYIEELKKKDKYIAKQELLISRQKSHLLILFFLFLIMTFFLLFSIVYFRLRFVNLTAFYKEHFQLTVGKRSTYYQNNNQQQIPSCEQEKFRKIYNGVLRLFEKEKIYLDPALTIRDIAQQLYTNEKYVSKAINLCAEMNFSNFLNKYRVHEAISFMQTPLHYPLSLEQIMEKSGFNSRSTFINAFKNITDMAPGQYRNQTSETKISKCLHQRGKAV